MNVVEISHVSKRFGDFTAVNDVSLSLAKGEILGLLGANGAGGPATCARLSRWSKS